MTEATTPRGSLLARLPPFLLLLGVGVWLELNLDKLPERYAIHYGRYGPDAWMTRHPVGVLLPLVVGLGIVSVLALMQWQLPAALRRERERLPSSDVSRIDVRWTARLLLACEYLVALTFACVALAPLMGPGAIKWIVGAGSLALFVVAVAVAIRAARDAARRGRGPNGAYWKAGLFYVNPADPALWVPKRVGLGFTLNFAHRKAWVILGLLVGAPLLLAVLLAVYLPR